jgi:hypothetical protein
MSSACHNLLLSSLTTYYKKHPSNRKSLKDIINGDSLISLRVIDWFVTHYARTHQVIYWIDGDKYLEKYPENGNPNIRKFHLYMEYRAQLQSYTKLFFDPFRRHERITFILETTPLSSIETTVGQLNFFRWAFQNHIFTYILDHLQHIEETMAKYQKQLKKSSDTTAAVATTIPALPIVSTTTKSTTTQEQKTQPIVKQQAGKNKTKKKDTHIGNIVLRTPCFIRFD